MSSEHYEDPCLSNPCSNGGSCIPSDGSPGYDCACLNGYEGAQCEITKGEFQYLTSIIIVLLFSFYTLD